MPLTSDLNRSISRTDHSTLLHWAHNANSQLIGVAKIFLVVTCKVNLRYIIFLATPDFNDCWDNWESEIIMHADNVLTQKEAVPAKSTNTRYVNQPSSWLSPSIVSRRRIDLQLTTFIRCLSLYTKHIHTEHNLFHENYAGKQDNTKCTNNLWSKEPIWASWEHHLL